MLAPAPFLTLASLSTLLTDLPWRTHVYIVGVAIAIACSLLSTYVVLRGMSLISEGVSHAGFGGIGVALVLGYYVNALSGDIGSRLITGVFCLLTALLINYVTRGQKVSEDAAIGIFLVASVALGDMLLHVYASLPGAKSLGGASVEQLLFGNFLGVGPTDDILAVATVLLCALVVGAFYYQFLYTTLDEEMARVNGVNTRLVNLLLLAMISLVIVIGVRMVGFLMITAMTIIPGATANMISRRFGGVLTASLLIGTLATLGALVLALNTRLDAFPAGPILVLTLFAVFVVTWVIRHTLKPRPISLPDTPPTPDASPHK